ncbi:MAG: DEAD/DEAH box helicase [archaeon]
MENIDKFKKLGIEGELLRAIERENFEEPSEIQEKSIPLVLEGKDVIGESATGSGKTLAFAAGIIKHCSRLGKLQALVLVPTRELAVQVTKSLVQFSEFKGLEIVPIYGGVDINPQMRRMRNADVVVGTPGRVLDHLERKTIYLAGIKMLILDEADRMLDMGFIRDIEKIIRQCNPERQTLLFSATVAPSIVEIAKKYMKGAKLVSAKNMVDPTKLKQVYYDIADSEKFSLLVHLLKNEKSGLVMVFCNTKHMTDFVAHNLEKQGLDVSPMHGGLSQNKRSATLEQFHVGRAHVLVCTDVAARGLDIKGVSHVYNYDVPIDAENYVHRIGRTARAGSEGIAITILASRDYENFSKINKRIVEVERIEAPKFEMIFVERKPRRESSGFGGRGSGGRSFGGRGGGRSFGGDRPHRSFSGGGRGFARRDEQDNRELSGRGRSEGMSEGAERRGGFSGGRGRSEGRRSSSRRY